MTRSREAAAAQQVFVGGPVQMSGEPVRVVRVVGKLETRWCGAGSSQTIDVVSIPFQNVPLSESRVAPELFDRGTGLPFMVALDDSDTPYDVVDALALAPFTSGEQPWAQSARIDRIRPGMSWLPAGARVLRSVVEDSRDSRLAVGDGWTLRAVRWRGGGGEVTVTAVSEELARGVLTGVVREAADESATDSSVMMGFWYLSARRGPNRTTRKAATTPWAAIRRNYADSAVSALDRLMAVRRDTATGRLILLHGPAGTGKTTLLRSLAYEWRRWCQVDCVLDPEALFADPGYLMEVAIGFDDGRDDVEAHDDRPGGTSTDNGQGDGAGEQGGGHVGERDGGRRRWRLLVVEDCDDLVREDGRSSSGQALSRLLNLTDGLVGQGREVMVALTTNSDVVRTHPAVVRPGRCLAQIEVGPLPHAQAAGWLGTAEGVGPAMTLAELYALRDGCAPVRATGPDTHSGLYL